MRLWLGLDDTDHLDGECTTWSMQTLLSVLERDHQFVVKEVRLVRLWPFAPERTRGNAALAAIVETRLNFDSACDLLSGSFRELICRPIRESASTASPGFVISREQPESDFYHTAVRESVEIETAIAHLDSVQGRAYYEPELGKMGLVGAIAAIGWPAEYHSWELTAWRYGGMIGKNRIISDTAIQMMEVQFPDTFLNRDPRSKRTIIAPRTPCPVLYGIRGTTRKGVESAHMFLQMSEGVERSQSYRCHRTNQTSDDHLSGIGTGVALSKSTSGIGGHASLKVFSNGGLIQLTAFREGGEVNRLLRQAESGDIVEWVGLESPSGGCHLERLRIVDSSPRISERPNCNCGSKLKSSGSLGALRCKKCGTEAARNWCTTTSLSDEWVEPSPSNRRHLAKPLAVGPPQ